MFPKKRGWLASLPALILGATALGQDAAEKAFEKSGNVAPRIIALTDEEEAAILADVKAADGFDVTLFANSAAANYPVYVTAAPNGDLYVSSDGNGSLGRAAGRGRVIRLRDADGDGKADEAVEFVKNVDSPRGSVWDHDRLYLVHPPDITCYIDHDGDGRADEEKTLVKGIAFDLKDRPADHTTNGLSLGIDGWLYIAVGDFGFMDAVGTDGRRLQLRGGGVVRFRPDGSGLELFSEGTRNILGTPISPLLDLFARDNTNDGGGWDVRFHHFTGLEDHGYPRLYVRFGDEIVQPLADYGGGSGCGATYLSEPGFPENWNHAPLTCDWGSGALWHHAVEPHGATFHETSAPKPLVKMTRPTDASVDGMSRLYQASWRGPATFDWKGPDVGYIVRVTPTGHTPEPLPDFETASDAALVALLESPSQTRALAAQRSLLRRAATPATKDTLLALARDGEKPLPARVAALYAISQRALRAGDAGPVIGDIAPLAADPHLQRFVLRALADAGLDRLPAKSSTAPAAIYAAGLESPDPRTRLEAAVGAARQHMTDLAPRIASLLGDSDPVVAHTAFRALALLGATDACFAVLDDPAAPTPRRTGALRALMRIHTPEAVDGLIARLSREENPSARHELIAALCRLYHREGPWNGDSWGTRPDTRGPYYQPESWSETTKITAVLKPELENASSASAAALLNELQRNRIQLGGELMTITQLVGEKPELLPALVSQLASSETIPAESIPLLIAAAGSDRPASILSQAVVILANKTDSREGCRASLSTLARLASMQGEENAFAAAKDAFLTSPKLENHHQLLEDHARELDGAASLWADAGLLALSARTTGSPESREVSREAIDHGWARPARRVQILRAAAISGFHGLDERILAATRDADPAVADAASQAADALKLTRENEDQTPLVSALGHEKAVADVLTAKGDPALGEQIFIRQSCVACHSTSLDQVQKGPYLGTIAQTYTRADLAANILDPGKTIAQGFATELFTLHDGSSRTGFVTFESADLVKARDITGEEMSWKTADIARREKLPISLMPPGLADTLTLHEFASLLDYLEALSEK